MSRYPAHQDATALNHAVASGALAAVEATRAALGGAVLHGDLGATSRIDPQADLRRGSEIEALGDQMQAEPLSRPFAGSFAMPNGAGLPAIALDRFLRLAHPLDGEGRRQHRLSVAGLEAGSHMEPHA